MRTHKIAALGGDGIGPEVVEAGLEVLAVCAERRLLRRLRLRRHVLALLRRVRLERLQAARYDEAARDALLDALGYSGDPLRVHPPALWAANAVRHPGQQNQ